MTNILVVDDEAAIRGLIADVLTQEGHVVSQAADGREARGKIRADSHGLVITDILMPEADGIELMMFLKNERPMVRVIATTGVPSGLMPYLQIARSLGAVRTLAKPFTVPELIRATREALA